MPSNENKISDGHRERVLFVLKLFQSSQNVNARRVAVRSIAWLDRTEFPLRIHLNNLRPNLIKVVGVNE
jgi:hypothetical protein